jgi:large subunit ribosomal protein L28
MPRVCAFTKKHTHSGWSRSEKGARRDGGVGNKIKGRTKRMIRPNLRKVRCLIDGEPKRVWVSTEAIKCGLVVKPFRVAAPAKAKA